MATQEEKIKWVEGSPFMVDGFRFTNPRCKHYLLTHFHSDHTTGLYKSFSAGTIYCSHGTANLIVELLGVNRERVVALPMDTPVLVAGFELILIDANHCPAAVMFVIRDPRPGGRTTLHTGDFRAAESVCTNPVVKSLKGRLDSLYLDTTYCAPRHTFPDQDEVLAQVAQLVRMELQRDPNTLFLVGTYSIGKEKVLEAVAKATGSRCLVTSRMARTMRLSGAWDGAVYTTHDAKTGGGVLDGDGDASGYARVRAVPLQDTNSPATLLAVLAEARAGGAPFTSAVGVRPTGWTHTNVRKGAGGGDKAGGIQSSIGGASASFCPAVRSGAVGEGESGQGDGGSTSGTRPASDVGGDVGVESELPSGVEDLEDEAWGAGFGDDGDEEIGAAATNGVGIVPPSNSSSSPAAASTARAAGAWSGKKPWVDGDARIYSLPYSEHSSFTQLRDFVRTVRPKKIVPTVNAASSASVEKMLNHFLEFMDLSSDRRRLESYFHKRDAPARTTSGRVEDTSASSGARASSALSCPAEKRRKNPTGAAALPPSLSSTKKYFRPPLDARQGNLRGDNETLARIGGETPRTKVVERPCAGRLQVEKIAEAAVPAASPPPTRAADAGAPAASMHGSADAAVELHLVDVEAQKAIMADIERRKRGQQHNQGRKQHDSVPAGARAAHSGSNAGKRRKPGLGREQTKSIRRSGGCSAERPKIGANAGVFFSGSGVSDAQEPRTVAETVGGCGGREVLPVDDECADPPEPMDIRDFFSRRG